MTPRLLENSGLKLINAPYASQVERTSGIKRCAAWRMASPRPVLLGAGDPFPLPELGSIGSRKKGANSAFACAMRAKSIALSGLLGRPGEDLLPWFHTSSKLGVPVPGVPGVAVEGDSTASA